MPRPAIALLLALILTTAPDALAMSGTVTGSAALQTSADGEREVMLAGPDQRLVMSEKDCAPPVWPQLLKAAEAGQKISVTLKKNVVIAVRLVK